MTRTSTLALTLLLTGVAQAQLSPTTMAPLAAHLLEVNTQWNTQDPQPVDGTKAVAFSTEAERIATHLRMVRERLMQRQPEGLTAAQMEKRSLMLDRLAQYADERRFPQNHVLPYRIPVFIDPYGTACAVGWLMIESGHLDLAEEISAAMNLAYVLDMPGTPQWPAIAAWAVEHGFEAEELAWIQPHYPVNAPWTPLGGGTNGPVTVLHSLANGYLLVAGSFTEAGGLPVNRVAMWDGATYIAMADGVEGIVNCAVEFNGDIYLGGGALDGAADLGRWDGVDWSFSTAFPGDESGIRALHVHNGELYAAGVSVGSTEGEYLVKKLGPNGWSTVGAPFNGAVKALDTFAGELITAGYFTASDGPDGTAMLHVARFDGTTWQQIADGLNAPVHDLLVSNGKLHACGDHFINGSTAFQLASLPPGNDTWLLHPIGAFSQIMAHSHYRTMTAYGDLIYLGGYFSYIPGIGDSGRHSASFNTQTNMVAPMDYFDAAVNASTIHGNRLVIGGAFTGRTIGPLPFVAILDITTNVIRPETEAHALTVFPNPALDRLTLQTTDMNLAQSVIHLTDMHGRNITVPIERQGDTAVLGVQGLAAGMYLVRVVQGEQVAQQRFIKE